MLQDKIYRAVVSQSRISTFVSIPIRRCLGEVYGAMGDHGKAIKEYKIILNQTRNDISLLGHIGNLYEQKGDIDNAIKVSAAHLYSVAGLRRMARIIYSM